LGDERGTGAFSAEDLLVMYQELVRSIRELHWHELLPVRLTMPQLKVLHVLCRHGKVTAGELAETLGVSAPTVTDIVERMSALGLVTKERGCEDRRVVYVSVTPAGEETLRQVLQERWSFYRDLFEGMSPGERDAVGRGLQALQEAVRRHSTLGRARTAPGGGNAKEHD